MCGNKFTFTYCVYNGPIKELDVIVNGGLTSARKAFYEYTDRSARRETVTILNIRCPEQDFRV